MPKAAILVEDNEIIRETLIPAMRELAGLEVLGVAATQEEGVLLLSQFKDAWQIAVVDLFLAQGSGVGVLRACRNREPGQQVVVLTNYATPQMRRTCLDLGADRVFDKSTELDEFFAFCQSLA